MSCGAYDVGITRKDTLHDMQSAGTADERRRSKDTQEGRMKVAVKCECGKRIADRDEQYIYIYCKKCKKTHRYKLSEPAPKKGQSRESHDP